MSVAISRALISVQGTSCTESDKCWQLWGWDLAGRIQVVQTDRQGEADRPNNDEVGVLVQTGVGKGLPLVEHAHFLRVRRCCETSLFLS